MTDDFDSALTRAQSWIDRDDVVAVGEGSDGVDRTIDVFVRGTPEAGRFPQTLDGVPVRVRSETGDIYAFDDDA